jgi:hypothetical protein
MIEDMQADESEEKGTFNDIAYRYHHPITISGNRIPVKE